MKDFWDRYEIPTVLLGLVLYASWGALVWFHESIPTLLLILLGGYVTQWHFSLQHESIHGMRTWPSWLRTAFVWPPLGLWMPYPVYNRSHSTHHVNFNITHPARDTESNYHLQGAWPLYNGAYKKLMMLNQTLLVRMAVGPFLRLYKLGKKEIGRIRSGDYSNAPHWATHVVSLAVILYFVMGMAHMPFWKYVLCFAYPGMALGMLRTFIEHRYAEKPLARVAIVESNTLMGVLYLYNNLHLVHHRQPTLAWYKIPARFRAEREELLRFNDNFYFPGYLDIARRFSFKPVFDPIHPKW
ncbi:MAG: fatty acid desaturase [Comamonadaceae bacterium]|nr:MAG: fatty acid desaturase [Comamonadaceae bacterium]